MAMQYSTRSITIESTILVTRANILDNRRDDQNVGSNLHSMH